MDREHAEERINGVSTRKYKQGPSDFGKHRLHTLIRHCKHKL